MATYKGRKVTVLGVESGDPMERRMRIRQDELDDSIEIVNQDEIVYDENDEQTHKPQVL